MMYDWKKPWLIMNPEVYERITEPAFRKEVEVFTNVLVTSDMPYKDEVWLLPANEIQRLINLSMNGLKYQLSEFKEKSE